MVFNNSILLGAAGQGGVTFNTTLIGNSAWFNGTDSRMDSPSFSAQSDPTCFTFATWVQINSFSVTNNQYIWSAERTGNYAAIGFDANDKLFAYSNPATFTSDMVFRDVGWYHIICSYKGAANTVRMFVNGVEITNTASNTLASPNPEPVAHSHTQRIGAYYVGATGGDLYETDAYLAQTVFLDGFSFQDGDISVSDFLDTFTFGTNGSQFIPKKDSELATLAGTAGANSYVLDYADGDSLGNDISSKNNNFTLTNLDSDNQSVHTPSKVYTTWNALRNFASSTVTLSEGNLKFGGGDGPVLSTKAIPSTGKWVVTGEVGAGDFTLGVATESVGNSKLGSDAKGFALVDTGVNLLSRTNNSDTNSTSALSAGNKVIAAFDADTGKLWLGSDTGSGYTYLGGGNPATGATPTYTISSTETLYFAGGGGNLTCDFGQNDFDGTIPSGFKSLNSTTLTAPDFQGIDYFDATIYEGTGRVQRVGDFVPFTDSETVANSVIFNDDDSAYLDRTYGTPTSAKKFTVSFWFKAGAGTNDQYLLSTGPGGGAADGNIYLNHSTGNGELWYADPNDGSGFGFRTARKFTDSSSWVHFCMGIDTTASSGSRLKVEINGVDQGQPSATAGSLLQNNQGGSALPSEPSLNQDMNLNKASAVYNIGRRTLTSGSPLDGYLANYYFIDGEKKQASDFGQLDTSTNRWVPKAYSGNFNDNGWKLAFGTAPGTSNGAGTDTSGEDHHWSENNFTASDQVTDSPSKNFAVYDTVKGAVYTAMSMSNGNLTTKSGNGSVALAQGFPIQDGYWYYEVNFVEDVANMVFGLYNPATTVTASTSNPTLTGIKENGGTVVIEDNGASNSAAGPTLSNPSAGDVVGIYIRKVGNSYGMWFSLNGTAMSNTPAATETATPDISFAATIELVPAVHYSNAGTKEAQTNFGQLLQFDGGATSFNAASDGYWKHAPVTGFKALNQDNLDDTASKLTAWAWIKNRDATDNHILVDRVRGVGKDLHSNSDPSSGLAPAEVTNINTVQRFLQRGVQIGSDVEVNTANESYVLWQWLVGDSATTGTAIPADNPPSLASTSLVADAGHFAVISYTGNATSGATIGHGMSAAPEMVWVKERDNANGWIVSTTDIGFNKVVRLDTLDTEGVDGGAFNSTAPSSTLITLGSNSGTNRSSGQMICYAFRSVPGVCKIGTYIGTGSATASPYVHVGFRPRWIILKNATVARDWVIVDTARTPINTAEKFLFPNLNIAEAARGSASGSDYDIDVLADAFRPLTVDGALNGNGNTIIYMAMADIGGNGTLPPIYGR